MVFSFFALSACPRQHMTQDVIRNLYKCTLRTLLVAWQARQALSGVIKHRGNHGTSPRTDVSMGKKQ